MNISKQNKHYSSLIVILWGLIFTKCFALEYLVQTYTVPINSALYIWLLSLTMAITATVVFIRLKAQTDIRQNNIGHKLTIWSISGIVMLIALATVYLSEDINPCTTPSLLAACLGTGYLVQGRLNKNLTDTLSGVGWWIGAAILFMQSTVESLLLFAGLIIALSVCPIAVQMICSKRKLQH